MMLYVHVAGLIIPYCANVVISPHARASGVTDSGKFGMVTKVSTLARLRERPSPHGSMDERTPGALKVRLISTWVSSLSTSFFLFSCLRKIRSSLLFVVSLILKFDTPQSAAAGRRGARA